MIYKAEATTSKNQYILRVNKNKFLDTKAPGHMTGKRINEGAISGIPNNVRFGASLRSYVCPKTGREYESVFKDIYPDQELFTHYGNKKSSGPTRTTPPAQNQRRMTIKRKVLPNTKRKTRKAVAKTVVRTQKIILVLNKAETDTETDYDSAEVSNGKGAEDIDATGR